MERKRVAEMSKGVGRPKVGGPLNLLDHNGKERKDEEWRGKHMLVSDIDGRKLLSLLDL